MGIFAKKPAAPSAASGPSPSLVDEEFIAFFPTLWEYLATNRYDDGGERLTATLLVFVEDDRVKLSLNDREASRALWCSGATVREAMEALEGMLSSGTAEWRRKAAYVQQKGQRRS